MHYSSGVYHGTEPYMKSKETASGDTASCYSCLQPDIPAADEKLRIAFFISREREQESRLLREREP